MTRKVVIILILLVSFLTLSPTIAQATDGSYQNELIDKIDFSALENYFSTLEQGGHDVLGGDVVQFVKDISQGNQKVELGRLWRIIVDSVFSSLTIITAL